MKYIGMLRSGTLEDPAIDISITPTERILPSPSGDIWLSGQVRNVGFETILVQFYRTSREAQFINLEPGENLFIKNIPCSRLIIRAAINTSVVNYNFVQVDTEEDEEDNQLLIYSQISKQITNIN